MASNKEDIVPSQQASLLECCMCGDSGLTHELFQCKVCQFRSQHSYCSNLYPKAESYKVCNWCLNQKEDSKEKSQNSCNSSASCKDNSEDDSKNKKKSDHHNQGPTGLKGSQRNNLKLQLIKNPIKKPKSPEKSPTTTRKRIITNARLEEKLRRTKSEEISNSGLITRHVFRNKVRRYKLLDEVSS
ncbi:hypothetical protein QUC31_000522 [Theobroma cacao]|uniref:Uncharacterized protein LOC18591777 n=2 Tax=Theobroma cacao TaxID=3641 RepID=A0AB32UUC2_THECC|nr:PREDICTED: uncharacterized protein LOC18591777 [Theobroma cacao]EOY15393.1 Uncharacterized protein TCM_034473 [Theobroma cacao]WRX29899.1 hypothetical protein QQP08_022386 [Theobroma cacao]